MQQADTTTMSRPGFVEEFPPVSYGVPDWEAITMIQPETLASKCLRKKRTIAAVLVSVLFFVLVAFVRRKHNAFDCSFHVLQEIHGERDEVSRDPAALLHFGESVSISAGGERVLIGDGTRFVYVYDKDSASGRYEQRERTTPSLEQEGPTKTIDVNGETKGVNTFLYSLSTSLSSDGSVFASGMEFDDTTTENNTTSTHTFTGVYVRRNGNTTIIPGFVDISSLSRLSPDGNTLVFLGASQKSADDSIVVVLRFSSVTNEWMELGEPITIKDMVFLDRETRGNGNHIAVSYNGNRIAFVGPQGGHLDNSFNKVCGDNTHQTIVYEYDAFGKVWRIVGEPFLEKGADVYSSVSISNDGMRLAYAISGYHANGCPTDGDYGKKGYEGKISIFDWNAIQYKWEQTGSPIIGKKAGNRFGYSLSLSGDGSRIMYGAPYFFSNGVRSHVQILEYTGKAWIARSRPFEDKDSVDLPGSSVALDTTGTHAITGHHYDQMAHVLQYTCKAVGE